MEAKAIKIREQINAAPLLRFGGNAFPEKMPFLKTYALVDSLDTKKDMCR